MYFRISISNFIEETMCSSQKSKTSNVNWKKHQNGKFPKFLDILHVIGADQIRSLRLVHRVLFFNQQQQKTGAIYASAVAIF